MIGQTLLHFRILERLGDGGMGVIYRAEDTRLGRPVALKFLAPQWSADAEARERFLQEARAASSLDHPNTCTIYEIETTEDGQPFIVMAFYRGETLKQRLARGALPWREAVDITSAAARGLAKAHQLGIVHRDIKPSNLMLTEDGVVKVLDFGIAKLSGVSGLTRAGRVIGSMDYMSPEQACGREVDRRSDIWSLAVVFYEMLTGRRPFRGDTDQAVLDAIVRGALQPAADFVPDLPPHVDRVLARALAKVPQDRYPDFGELAAELSGEKPTSTLALPHAEELRARPSIAVLPFVDMSPEQDQEYFCDGIAEELIHVLSRVPGLRVAARTSTFQFKGRMGDLQVIRDRLGVSTLLEGGVRKAGERLRITAQLVNLADGYQLWSGRYDRDTADIFAIQEEIAATIVETLKPRLIGEERFAARAPAPDFAVYNLVLKGRFHWNKRTEEGLRRSAGYFREAIARAPEYARGYSGLADACLLLGVYGLAPPGEVMPQAREAALRALELGIGGPEVYTSLGCLRSVYDWTWAEAERDFLRAIDMDPDYATAHHWYAINLLANLGRFADAMEEIRVARELDPVSLPINTSAGLILSFAGRYEEAVAELHKALEIEPRFAMAHFFLGQTEAAMGEAAAAIASLRRAVELSGGAAEMHAALGRAQALAGRPDAARRILAELLRQREQGYVSASLIAQVHAALGDTEQALTWLETAWRERAADLAWVAVRPAFAGLRGEPRFRALLARMGLAGRPAAELDVAGAEPGPATLL